MGEHQKLKTFTRKHNNKFRTVLDLSAHQLFTTATLHLLGFKNNIVCNASGTPAGKYLLLKNILKI